MSETIIPFTIKVATTATQYWAVTRYMHSQPEASKTWHAELMADIQAVWDTHATKIQQVPQCES